MTLTKIKYKEDLYKYLQIALKLEHATIPPYLMALYSIHPETNLDAYNVIRVVVVEEMLHLTLAANIYNALGGKPDLTVPGFVPKYPTYLPDGETDFKVSLRRFSKRAVDTFMKIERPAISESKKSRGSSSKSDCSDTEQGEPHHLIRRKKLKSRLLPAHIMKRTAAGKSNLKKEKEEELHFYSIGDFYAEIERGLICLDKQYKKKKKKLFTGDAARQVTSKYYYSGGGDIIPVFDINSAKKAIRLITEQGEGYEGGVFDHEGELSHFYRFEQLKLGKYYHKGDKPHHPTGERLKIDWKAVYPLKTNPRIKRDYPDGSELKAAALDFNSFYKKFLEKINQAFDGHPELLIEAVGDMFKIKEKAYQLMRNPIPGKEGVNAAPTFEIKSKTKSPKVKTKN